MTRTGIQELWDDVKRELESVDQPGFDYREGIREFERETGVDLEGDIIGWITGEIAFALLPSEFQFNRFGDVEGALIHAIGLLEFDDLSEVEDALENVTTALEREGVVFEEVRIKGLDAVIAEPLLPGEFIDNFEYEPGYLITGRRLVVGSTRESLEQAVDAVDGTIPTLAESPEYIRIIAEAGDGLDFLFYANIPEIIDLVLDAAGPAAEDTYEDDVRPYVDPLESFLFGVNFSEALTTWTTILTFN